MGVLVNDSVLSDPTLWGNCFRTRIQSPKCRFNKVPSPELGGSASVARALCPERFDLIVLLFCTVVALLWAAFNRTPFLTFLSFFSKCCCPHLFSREWVWWERLSVGFALHASPHWVWCNLPNIPGCFPSFLCWCFSLIKNWVSW